jgi:hypothetical protein
MWGRSRCGRECPAATVTAPCGEEAKVFDPPVDDSSTITGARQVPLGGSGEQFSDRIGAGSSEEQ